MHVANAFKPRLLQAGLILAGMAFSATALAEVRATVGHFAPFADSLAGTSVSIRVNGAEALSDVRYGQFTEYLTLGEAGTYLLEVVPTGTMTAAISAEVTLPDGDYTVLASGDGTNQPLGLIALSDDNSAPADGNIKLRVVHAAPFAAGDGTAVSVRDQNNAVVGGLASVPFGAFSDYLEVPAGRYDLKVASPDGSADFIDARPVRLDSGAIVTVVAQGGANGFPLGLSAIAPGAAPTNPLALFEIGPVNVTVAHLAPFAPVIADTAVNVLVNGTQILSGVTYKQFTDPLPLPAQGAYQIDVVPVGATEPAISGELQLDGNRGYVAAAVGNGLTQPLDLLATEVPAIDGGDYALRVVHAAPFAATAAATAVSIRTDGGAVVAGLSEVPYGAFSPALSLPVGALDLKVATPNGSTNLIDLPEVELPAGVQATVFAIGDGINQPLGILALPVGELPLETPVDFSSNGHWNIVDQIFEGLSLIPRPEENRLVGTWYSYATAGGDQRWFVVDTCQSAPGDSSCANPGGFDNRTAEMAVYSTSGGTFGGGNMPMLTRVGLLTLDFGDTPCTDAQASYEIDGIGSGTFAITNLMPSAACLDAR